jgi:hypothetical protein
MSYKGLYIFVEYNDDLRFFERIIKPLFEGKYDWVTLWRYAQQKKDKVSSFIRSLSKMNAKYIYTTDINDAPSVTARKQEVRGKFGDIDDDRIVVVKMEIESWYLAGLDDACCKKLGISPLQSTDDITKEQFDDLIPRKFRASRIDLLKEILKHFDIETAKQKNTSLKDFLDNYDCEF